MGKRRVQHRQQRDANTKAQRDTEQENKRLKREVARLRKQLDQAGTPPEPVVISEANVPSIKCPSCKGTELTSITTPSGKTRHVCRTCSWRGAI